MYVTPQEIDRQEFWRLRKSRFDYTTTADWDAYYARMSPYLMCTDSDIRRKALERLSTAVMWAERRSRVSGEHSTERLKWFVRLIEEANVSFGDTAAGFLDELTFKGDPPFDSFLRELLHCWQKKIPKGVFPD